MIRAKLGQWVNGTFMAGPTFSGSPKWVERQADKLAAATGNPVTVVRLS